MLTLLIGFLKFMKKIADKKYVSNKEAKRDKCYVKKNRITKQ